MVTDGNGKADDDGDRGGGGGDGDIYLVAPESLVTLSSMQRKFPRVLRSSL